MTRKGPSTSQSVQGAGNPEPRGFWSLSVHPSRVSGRQAQHRGGSPPAMRGIHWPSYPWLPGPRGRERRKETVRKGQRVRQQPRSCLPRAAVVQVVHCSRAAGRRRKQAEVQVHTPLAKLHVWAQGRICPEEGTHFLMFTKVPHRLKRPPGNLPQAGKDQDRLRPPPPALAPWSAGKSSYLLLPPPPSLTPLPPQTSGAVSQV